MAVPDGTKVSSAWWGGSQKTVGTTFGEWENVTVGGVSYAGPHTGIDIPMDVGTPITSPVHATVESAGTDKNGSNFVKLKLDNGLTVLLLHLSEALVHTGQDVSPGTEVATSGNSGLSTGPHLHFEVDQGSSPIDPWSILNMSSTAPAAQGGSLLDFGSLVQPIQDAGKILSFVTDKRNWYKTMFIAAGLGLIGFGVFVYFFQSEKQIVISTAKGVALA